MELIPVEICKQAPIILYELLKEREPEQSISHKQLPSFDEHVEFIDGFPYLVWYLIWTEHWAKSVGAIYLTPQREIGIGIFKSERGKGYATEAVKMLMQLHPGRFLANINPENYASRMFFTEQFDAKLIQNTFEICS